MSEAPVAHLPPAAFGKLAIITRNYDTYSETFVRRHIAELFGGKTVVVAFEPATMPPENKEFHVFSKQRDGTDGPSPTASFWRRLSTITGHEKRLRNRSLVQFLERNGVTHVLCEFGYVATEVAEAISRTGRPVFCYFRGNDASKRLHEPEYVDALRRVFPRLAGVIAVSQSLLDNLASHGLTHANSVVIPSGTDVDLIRPDHGEGNHLLTVGRLVEKKDPLTTLRAFAKVADRHPDVSWTIIGSGPLSEDLSNLTRSLGLIERVSIMGACPHADVLELMIRSRVYFQSFRTASNGDSEGMPNVIQEAMAAGRAIVTTRHAGIPEHIEHGVSGLLYDEGDEAGLADGLDRVLSSQDLRDRMGRAARAYAVERLDYRVLYRRLEDFLLNPRPSQPSDDKV